MAEGAGTLYLCATPIGNLDDLSFRAVAILKTVSLIAAEDTRHTRKLTSRFDIHCPLTSYHEHNKVRKGPELLEKLRAGQDVALVSDAGMPGISDPGEDLVRLAVQAGITVTPIPGPCAVRPSQHTRPRKKIFPAPLTANRGYDILTVLILLIH